VSMQTPRDLKPCPFWNGPAGIDQFNPDKRNEWRMICETKNCAWGPERATEAEAIAAWNTRSAIAAMQPALPDVALLKGTTPGPWKVDMSYQSPSYIRAANGVLVASACWAIGDDGQTIANARLIAAAPDLARENALLKAESATAWQQGYNHGADKFRAALETERLIVASLRREVKIAGDQWEAKCDQIATEDAEFATLRKAAQCARDFLRCFDGSPSVSGDAFKVLDAALGAGDGA